MNLKGYDSPETFLRPPHLAHRGYLPCIVSDTIAENVELDVPGRAESRVVDVAQISEDVAATGAADDRGAP